MTVIPADDDPVAASPRVENVLLKHGRICKCGLAIGSALFEARVLLRGLRIDVGLTGDGELKLPHGIQVAHADVFLIEQALQSAAIEALRKRFSAHNAQRPQGRSE
jgi:hypothetical protein